jgi:hypothetical protein
MFVNAIRRNLHYTQKIGAGGRPALHAIRISLRD